MARTSSPHALLRAEQIAALTPTRYQHPVNDNGLRLTRSLGDAAGLRNIGLHLVRVEPGHDSTEYHVHHFAEEFAYVLEGRGVLELADGEHAVAPGDFMGFAAGGSPHALRNTGERDLVYLVGGQRLAFDVCDYPRARRRLFSWSDREQYTELPDAAD